jgi:exodeoxyribonuclease V alpha subunit
MILKDHPDSSEKLGAFLIKLLIAARAGHLCLKKTKGALLPSCKELIDDQDTAAMLDDLSFAGIKDIPKEIIGDSLDKSKNFYPLFLLSDLYYLNKNLFFENRFLHQIRKIQSLHKEEIDYLVQPSVLLNEGQKQAVILSLTNNVTLITGGPGTGKTFTATEIVKEYYPCAGM